MWPPPRPPNSGRSAKTLPSNIRVEREASQEDEKLELRKSGDDSMARGQGGGKNLSRQSSHVRGEDDSSSRPSSGHHHPKPQEGDEADSRQRPARDTSSDGAGDQQKDKSNHEWGRDDSTRRQTDVDGQSTYEEPGSGEKRKNYFYYRLCFALFGCCLHKELSKFIFHPIGEENGISSMEFISSFFL